MKQFAFYILILIGMLSKPNFCKAQCDNEEYKTQCVKSAFESFDNYTYVKSRTFYAENTKQKIHLVSLKRNVRYIFSVCQSNLNNNDLVINLVDRNNKIIESSFNEKTGKNTHSINFHSKTAGRYYITTRYIRKGDACCEILIGMSS